MVKEADGSSVYKNFTPIFGSGFVCPCRTNEPRHCCSPKQASHLKTAKYQTKGIRSSKNASVSALTSFHYSYFNLFQVSNIGLSWAEKEDSKTTTHTLLQGTMLFYKKSFLQQVSRWLLSSKQTNNRERKKKLKVAILDSERRQNITLILL